MECHGDDTHLTFHDTSLFSLHVLLVYVNKFNIHDTLMTLPLRLASEILDECAVWPRRLPRAPSCVVGLGVIDNVTPGGVLPLGLVAGQPVTAPPPTPRSLVQSQWECHRHNYLD